MKILCKDGLLSYDTDSGEICWAVSRSNRVNVGVPIRQPLSGKNYVQVRVDGKLMLAHRIAWEAVHGLIPESLEINHINGKRNDNRLSNLELVTHQDNMRHAKRTGLTPHCTRPERPVIGVCKKTGSGLYFKNSVVASKFGFGDVTQAANGKRKSCKGFKWEYAA